MKKFIILIPLYNDWKSVSKLLKEIEELYESDVSREHAFNRFNVRLNYGSNRVTIEDEINPGEDGKVEVALSEFKSALRPTS